MRYAIFAVTLFALWTDSCFAKMWPHPPAWWMKGPGACIRQMESQNGRDPLARGNLYGMLDGWSVSGGHGKAGDHSRREQDYRTYKLWLRYHWEPWRGRTADHCN